MHTDRDGSDQAAPKGDFAADSAGTPAAEIPSLALFGAQRRMVTIEHRGERYRLRITRAGKLLLTK